MSLATRFTPLALHTALMLAFGQTVYAADSATQQEAQLADVQVVGSAGKAGGIRFNDSQSTAIINADQIRDMGAHKIDQALQYQAGILAEPFGADNKVEWFKIRGFDASVAVDGNITTPSGYFVWTPNSYGVEKIEVLKGANSFLYGSGESGGVVNLVTKRPKDTPAGEIVINTGSQDRYGIGADYSGLINNDHRLRYRVVTQYSKEGNDIDFAHMRHEYLAPSLTWDINDRTSLTLLSSYQHDKGRPTNGFLPFYGTVLNTPYGKINRHTSMGEPDFDTLDRSEYALGYELSHRFDNGWQFSQNYRFSFMDLDERNVFAYGSDNDRKVHRGYTYTDGTSKSHNLDNRLSKTWRNDRFENTLLLGIDYVHAQSDGKNNGFGYVPDLDMFDPHYGTHIDLEATPYHTKLRQLGGYVQNQFKWDQHWLVNLGLRHDKVKADSDMTQVKDHGDYSHNTVNAGLMYIATNGLAPYINYSESFKPVLGTDGYGRAYKPYEGRQYEAGLKYSPTWVDGTFTLAYFDLQEKNALVADASNIQSQVGKRKSRGVELQANVDVTENWKLAASYTYMNPKQDLSVKERIRTPMMPHNMANAQVQYQFHSGRLNGLTLGTGLRYVGSSNDEQYYAGYKIPSYTLWDAMAQYHVAKNWQLQLNARNLTDKKYVSGCSFYCYYGAARSVEGSLRYQW
ncbi:TonB-dependent siderophore receptor [Neisseriaceae bacterium ESL0693]|nr:TonB-dependent siderophore receptor [Neisseriaceae bacterium ESL0693]